MVNSFTDLVLLVGMNPLPNYVVASHFLQKYPHINIHFIYSQDTGFQQSTKKYAENIKNTLIKNYCCPNSTFGNFISLENVENAKQIKTQFLSFLKSLKKNTVLHLNYTGGTKVMGTHIHELLHDQTDRCNEFSYLSPKTFRLLDDEGVFLSNDLRESVTLNFDDLIALHGFQRIPKSVNPSFDAAISLISNLIENGTLDSYYKGTGCYKRNNFSDSKGELIYSGKKLKNKYVCSETTGGGIKPVIAEGNFLTVNNSLPVEFQLFAANGTLKDDLPSDADLKHTIKFFDGDWLEQYVFKTLSEGLTNVSVDKNWEIRDPEWQKINPDLKFELDCILLRGYQLFGISCSTAGNKGLCKHKGFEIILRTKQIGGDEAKAVLITILSEEKARALQQELAYDTGSMSSILVLGINDLKKSNLLDKINKFIGI